MLSIIAGVDTLHGAEPRFRSDLPHGPGSYASRPAPAKTPVAKPAAVVEKGKEKYIRQQRARCRSAPMRRLGPVLSGSWLN
jgi:hypothetical protein